MLNKKMFLSIALCTFFAATAAALPQVAVLKTILAAGIDPTTESPLTAKIEEALVVSGRFQVLDRVNVELVLKEKEFQVSSGLVSNDEMQRVGNYLGADYVVVAYASRVGQTYSFSAKMIDVSTGQIVAQASKEGAGKIDVLLELATDVAGRLVVGGPAVPPQDEKTPVQTQESVPAPFYANSVLFSLSMSYKIHSGGSEIILSGSYCFRFSDIFGATGLFGWGLGPMGYGSIDLKTLIITIGPMLSVSSGFDLGMRIGYINSPIPTYEAGNENWTSVGFFGLNPMMLFKFGRFCLGIESFIGIGEEITFALGASLGASF